MSKMLKKEIHRGIVTNPKPRFEDEPVTVVNRLGQKTMSLPRIDDKKRWSGYAGVAGVAKKVAKLVPKCDVYVEPFAGSVKVFQELPESKYRLAVLNDMAGFVVRWLSREFPEAKITQNDFVDCVRRLDSKKTFFLFDMPYYRSYYDQPFSYFDRESVRQYSEEVLELCRKMKGKFIITSRRENKVLKNCEFNHKFVKSIYVVSGHYPIVMLTTNLKV